MDNLTSWVGILVFGFGLYCFWAAYKMKVKGEIDASLLLGKEYQYKTCKNKEAYIKEMLPQVLVFAIVTTLCGAVDIVNSFVVDIYVAYLISLAVFIIEFVWFIRISAKIRKKYY